MILWDLRTGTQRMTYQGPTTKSPHPGPEVGATCVKVDWSKSVFATGGNDGFVRLWSLETGEMTRSIDCEHTQTLALDADWDNKLLLTGSWDNQVKLFNLESGECLKHFRGPIRTITQVSLKKEKR